MAFKHPLLEGFVQESKALPEHLRGQFVQQRYRLAFSVSATATALDGITQRSAFVSLTQSDYLVLCSSSTQPPQQQLEDEYEDLRGRIDKALESFANHRGFVKLDSRSPKDAAVANTKDPQMQQLVLDQVGLQLTKTCGRATGVESIPPQCVLNGLMAALQSKLCVASGAEAIDLLKASWRVREDIHSVEPLFPYVKTNVVLREWVADMPGQPECEFRGFVVDNKLTAVSQYDYLCFYPVVAQNVAVLSEAFQKFFEMELRQRLQHIGTYVVDFFVDLDAVIHNTNGTPAMKVVELNSFESWTGACLFSWSRDHDILLGKTANTLPVLRVVTKQPEDQEILDMIPKDWLTIITQHWRIKGHHSTATTTPPSPTQCVVC